MAGSEPPGAAEVRHLVAFALALTGDRDSATRLTEGALNRLRRGLSRPAGGRLDRAARRALVSEYLTLRQALPAHLPSRAGHHDHAESAWRRLHRHQRVVLALRLGSGLPDAEIADALGCPLAQVPVIASRALGRLRRRGFQPTGSPGADPREVTAGLVADWLRLRQEPLDDAFAAVGRLPAGSTRRTRAGRTVPWAVGAAVLTLAALTVGGARQPASIVAPPPEPAPSPTTLPVDPVFGPRGAYVLTRFALARDQAAPPQLVVIGPVWEPSSAKDSAATRQLVRGRLRDEMAPIDDRAAVGTVRFPDLSESMTPVLGLHETFAELVKEVPACRGCTPVVAVEGRLTSMTIRTSVGKAVVPAQEYRFKGSPLKVRRMAIPRSSLVLLPRLPGGEGVLPVSAVAVPVVVEGGVGETLTLTIDPAATAGGTVCQGRYRAAVVESPDAISVGIVPVSTRSAGRAAACPAERRVETFKVTLRDPLASRVVLDGATGMPLVVSRR